MLDSQHPSQVSLKNCYITKPNGLLATKVALNPSMIVNFDLRENLYSPFMGGTITISDSVNFINSYPITGGEIIEFEIETNYTEEPVTWKLIVNSVQVRLLPDPKKQLYVLKLVSRELPINETVRINRKLKGNFKKLILDIVKDDLKSDKEVFAETSSNQIVKIPSESDSRPFDVISELTSKFIPKPSKEKDNEKKTIKKSQSDSSKIRGTAGCFFWETRRGYNFFSADALCDIGTTRKFAKDEFIAEQWGPLIESTGNIEDEKVGDTRNQIKSIMFTKEIDVMKSLRSGKYATKVILFNSGTQEYEELFYNLSDSWNDMAHLGNQNSYDEIDFSPAGEFNSLNVATATRSMSFIIDHEQFFNDPGIANPEDDSEPKNPSPTPEMYKYFAAQSSARFDLLTNQECVIKIHGNPFMCAGDRVKLLLQSKLPDALSSIMALDVESSGTYIIKELTHNYNMAEGTSGTCDTTLRLMRDAYGIESDPSAHGQ